MLGRFGACLAATSSLLAVATLPSTASAQVNTLAQGPGHYTIRLTPQEVTGDGNPGGSGSAQVDLDEVRQQVCYSLSWKDLRGDVTMANLHGAPRGQDGPHAVEFFNDQRFPGGRSTASGCVASTRDKIQAIIANPAGYYVNLHTTAFPNGAIRGQLG